MTPRYRAWHKTWEEMGRITFIRYKKSGEIFHLSFRRNIYNGNIYGGLVKLDEIELMQSTGLVDKNGKEIFEGDIVRTTRFLGRADEIGGFYEYEKDYLGVVKVLEGSWVIDTGSDAVNLWSEIDENEVLGNIYENLELLEDKE